jgi:hypothetical protein
LPFLFAAADLPNGGICFGWVDVDPVVVFDDGIDFWAPVAVVIVVVADWSGRTAPCIPWSLCRGHVYNVFGESTC